MMTEQTKNDPIDKKAIKSFAVAARRKLIEGVEQKAYAFGITKQQIQNADSVKINGFPMDETQQKQRKHLVEKIKHSGFNEVIEEVAYTWFNRFIALRFMEVNDYLPSGIRILSSIDGKRDPDILSNIELVADELQLDRNKVYDLQDRNALDQLFKYILIHQCNELSQMMPSIFEPIDDATELLLPDHLLREGSVIRKLVDEIKEENWKHQIEIIGWLYQYYISEEKDQVFARLKKNIKIGKEDIPAATQLFTPKWIVQYMVENSLGRLWLESHPDQEMRQQWPYYLDEAQQEAEVQKKIDAQKNHQLSPESIKFLDPCMGSGHILVDAFDVFFSIYQKAGYSVRDIPRLILEKNLYGLEIDERAKQLAYFSLMMKARHYDRQLFQKPVHVHVYAIQESNSITQDEIDLVAGDNSDRNQVVALVNLFKDARLYGSILKVPGEIDLDLLRSRLKALREDKSHNLFIEEFQQRNLKLFENMLEQATMLSMKYDVVVTNPPYMGRKGMNDKLSIYIKKHYPDESADLFAVMMERCRCFSEKKGFISMITQQSWMFLSSFEKMRIHLLNQEQIYSMVHLGARAFAEIGGEVVQSTMFVSHHYYIPNYQGTFIRLVDFKSANEKRKQFNNNRFYYTRSQSAFSDIPGSPIAYWASDQVRKIFRENPKLGDVAEPRQGMATADNNRFLRLWHEVNFNRIGFNYKSREEALRSKQKWFPYNKGGAFRKWYGNMEYVVNWKNDGEEIKNFVIKRYPYLNGNYEYVVKNMKYYFREGITWTAISRKHFSVRYVDKGSIFSNAGMMIFTRNKVELLFLLGLVNSKQAFMLISQLSSTLNFDQGVVRRIPVNEGNSDAVINLVNKNINIATIDWYSFETSWDFKQHPLIEFRNGAATIDEAYNNWAREAERRFTTLKANEEELNRIFINLYGLQDELTSEESDDEVTVRRADRERDVKSFLSYCVGIMFGRYSLGEDGLIFAGGTFDRNRYRTYKPDKDNVIPITDETYFEDDIVGRFIDIVKRIFGEQTLEQNLDFIAESLKKKSGETARQRIRRYFLKEFYKNHVQIYKKRPIYWLFDSGKENGFKALIYLHRYEPGLVARVRTDYLHAMERKYEEEMQRLDLQMEAEAPERDKVRARKQKEKLQKQLEECRQYDQVVAHVASQQIPLDLDDGVKVNYAKFQNIDVPGKKVKVNLLAKI